MRNFIKLGLGTAMLALLAVGCKNAETSKLAEEVESLKKRVAALESRPTRSPMPPPQESAYNLPIGNSYVLGNKAAPVTVTVFSDYQCQFCSKVDPVVNAVVNDPELKDKVNVVMKHYPLSFHKDAKPAAKAALAAGEQGSDKFWKMSEKIFQNQTALTADNFSKWAKEIGLDLAKFAKDLKENDSKYEKVMEEDTQLGIKVANVRGTPSIYVGGWLLVGERSVESIKNLIRDKKLISMN